MVTDESATEVRKSYEWARMRRSLLWAGIMVALAMSVAKLSGAVGALWPFGVALVLLAAVEYRGQSAMKGARRGYLAGMAVLAAPLGLLRPCCIGMDAVAAGANCCTMPGVCALVGGGIGLALSFARPRSGSAIEGAFGLWLGVSAIASMRCTGMFLGEAVGLLGGLFAGILVSSAALAIRRPAMR